MTARHELTQAERDEFVQRALASAPALTQEQIRRLQEKARPRVAAVPVRREAS